MSTALSAVNDIKAMKVVLIRIKFHAKFTQKRFGTTLVKGHYGKSQDRK